MPTPVQHRNIRRFHNSGFAISDIASMTGTSRDEVREAIEPRDFLTLTFIRFMSRVPKWWKGTPQSYYHCVRFNFADVA